MRRDQTEPFYGRIAERQLLRRAINANRPELGILYGRRRIGKSRLLTQVAKKGDLLFEGLQKATARQQVEHFTTQLARTTGTPKVSARNWTEAFDALSWHIKRGRHYIVFDEFPWMANGRTELVSLLKYYWDNLWKKNKKVTLVLCGSVSSFMVKHLVHSEALHNRKTFEIRLEPLPAYESRAFFRDLRSGHEIAKFLMVFGGIPKYLEQIDVSKSFVVNMDRLCFNKNGFFLNEFETIFKEQFRVTKTYEAIVKQLARGGCSREQLANRLKKTSGGGLHSYVEALERADFVKTFSPISLDGSGSKTTRVVLWDEWIRFYAAYVRSHRKVIALNTKPGLFNQLAGKSIDAYFGLAFERLCMKNLPSLLQALDIELRDLLDFGPFFKQPSRKTGKPGAQIDLMLRRRGDVVSVIECKFRTDPIGLTVVREMKKKISLLAPPKSHTVERILVSAGPVSQELMASGYFHQILGLDAVFGEPGS